MNHLVNLSTWTDEICSRFSHLSNPTAKNLALYSFGLILAERSGLSSVAKTLSDELGDSYDALRKRLSEFYKPADAKSGSQRRDFDVTTCFPCLLRWIVSLWQSTTLPLAIDVTNLTDRFHVLCVSVVIRGTAIPIAWKILEGGEPTSWNRHWKKLLKSLKGIVPKDWTVLVMSDRGLQSPALFKSIKKMGWHPLMRVRQDGKFLPAQSEHWYRLPELLPKVGDSIQVIGKAFTKSQLQCTLLGNWVEGYEEPWLVLTDLPPSAGNVVWYSYRCWIEPSFKFIKSGQWQWQLSKMSDPDRAERLWLVMAVATLWTVAIGDAQEVQAEQIELEKLAQLSAEEEAQKQTQKAYQKECQRKALDERKRKKEQRKRAQEKKRQEKKAKKGKKTKQTDNPKQVEQTTKKTGKTKKKAEKAKDTKKSYQPRKPSRSKRVWNVATLGLRAIKRMLLKGVVLMPLALHPEPFPPPNPEITIFNENDYRQQKT